MDDLRNFRKHKSIWEENALKNAEWAILSDPNRLKTAWEDTEFLASGRKEIQTLLKKLKKQEISLNFEKSLDFGCGLGRLTQALSEHFKSSSGVDVSSEMIRRAREKSDNCLFYHNPETHLKLFMNHEFDFVLSFLVFQHIPQPYSLYYLKEIIRILKPGGVAILQIPSKRTQSLKNTLRSKIPEKIFYWKHKVLKPSTPYVTMFGIPKETVLEKIKEFGGKTLHIESNQSAGESWESYTYYIRN